MTVSHADGGGTEITATPAGRYRTQLLAIAAACVVAGLLAFTIDLPVARWCKQRPTPLPGDLLKFLNLAEAFAHGLGVTALILTLLVSDPALALPLPGRPAGPRWNFLRLVGATAVGGLLVDLVKVCVERVRPNAADLADVPSALATFGSSALEGPLHHAAQLMSFPSGHAAAAAGLGFVGLLGLSIAAAVPEIARWTPVGLTAPAAALATGRSALADLGADLWVPVGTTIGLIALALVGSAAAFRRREL